MVDKIIELYKTMSIENVANLVGMSNKKVAAILIDNNVILRSRSETIKLTKSLNKKVDLINWNTKKDRNKHIIAMYNNNIGSHTIAKSLSISKYTVLKVLEDNNISRNNDYKKPVDTSKASKLYKSGKSLNEIAKNLNVCVQTLNNRMSNKRTPGETMSSLFGKQDEIKKLYNNEYSTYEIAEILNINNPDAIARFLNNEGILRTREEIRPIVAKKLANRQYFKSGIHKKLEEVLKNRCIDFISEFPLDGWNFDVCVGNKLFEIQGEYWHKLPQRLQRDKKKKKVAEEAGYSVYYIWESQFSDIDFIMDYIDYVMFGTHIEFSLNDVVIKKVSRNDATKVKSWHYSGSMGNSSTIYGAFLNDELISICCFGSITRHGIAKKQGVLANQILELSRFVIHPKYHKKNLASWFISRCIKLVRQDFPKLKMLVSFADPSYNHDGGIYKASNWMLDGTTAPNYWYVSGSRNIIHKKAVWNKAKSAGITEKEYAQSNNLKKVLGDGKIRYLFRYK